MKMRLFTGLLALSAVFVLSNFTMAQEGAQEDKGYAFTNEIELEATPVKNQYRSGTCWSYAAVSFLESELIRKGKGELDLSEIWFARKAYELKAERYVRVHGKGNFSQGGMAFDVTHIWKNFGVYPQDTYTGSTYGNGLPVHGEVEAVMKGYLDALIKNPDRELSPVWKSGFSGILDAYMGKAPESFELEGKSYTPASYADELGLDMDDYVVVGSFMSQPYYQPAKFEVPDNWMWESIENVSLEEMMSVLDNALEKGYTVCWDADVSERGYNWNEGLALIPSDRVEDQSGMERDRWSELSAREKQARMYDFSTRKTELEITDEWRQKQFDNYKTTDDHLMHITGRATDQDGKTFYIVKNSWDTANKYEGYHYISEAFMKGKTLFFMVHRDALPKDLARKLK